MNVALVVLVYATQLAIGLPLAVASCRGRMSLAGLLGVALLVGPAALAFELLLFDFIGVRWSLPLVLAPAWIAAIVTLPKLVRGAPVAGLSLAERTLVAIAILVAGVSAVRGLQTPLYASDPIKNFALNARVFEAYGRLAPEALLELRSAGHREYPPLVALNEALIFRAAGDEGLLAVKPFFALAQLAFGLLVVEALRGRGRTTSTLALGVLFLLMPQVARSGADGLADSRLAAGLLALALAARSLLVDPNARSAIAVALLAGACALTKNEGLPFAAAAAAALVALAALRRLTPACAIGSSAVLAAMALPWPIWKQIHGIREIYLSGAADQSFADNLGRLPAIGAAFWKGALWPEQVDAWLPSIHWLVALALAAVALVGPSRREVAVWVGLLLAHLGLYAAVFVLTPREFEWHIASASERLVSHTLPWLVLIAAAAVASITPPRAAPRSRPAS